ncbi:MAG: hypothetical protein K2X32_10175 [Phycisphaerales bacterium]|nr:hypothetical protein [Phycisphaerales bacterium]
MIHILGDSHSSIFTGLHGVAPVFPRQSPGALPSFRTCHLGPYLAHSVATPGHPVRRLISRALRPAAPRDRVLFVFGEIDCRCHLARRATSARTIEAAAADVAERYIHAVRELSPNRQTAVLCVPPATIAKLSDARFPTAGSFDQRSKAADSFNRVLRRVGRKLGIQVFGPFRPLATPDGEPRPQYFADGVHADPRALPLFARAMVRAGWLRATDPTLRAIAALATVPPPMDARHRELLIDRAALTCLATGATRIALFGAGAHTRAMGIRPFEARGLRVVVILDDHATESVLHGVRVLHPDALREPIDAVVISSDSHEAAILRRARAVFEPRGIACVPIYDAAIEPLPGAAIAPRTVSSRRVTKAS